MKKERLKQNIRDLHKAYEDVDEMLSHVMATHVIYMDAYGHSSEDIIKLEKRLIAKHRDQQREISRLVHTYFEKYGIGFKPEDYTLGYEVEYAYMHAMERLTGEKFL